MIRSMTGFASEYINTEKYDVSMEIKSVNSRYFEFKMKSNASIEEWENDIKNAINSKLKRGKIDLYLKIVEKDAQNYNIIVNYELAEKYETALVSLSQKIGIVSDLAMKDFISFNNILQIERIGGYEDLFETIMKTLDSLLEKIMEMMLSEGAKTREDIEKSLNIIKESTAFIEKIYPESLEKYKKSLKERLLELMPGSFEDQLANNRLLLELEMIASRTAINEEIVRLKSHLSQFKKIIDGIMTGDSKKLDFISQEMNRETNTIASKSSEYTIIENTIMIKGEIEKIREQLRNLE